MKLTHLLLPAAVAGALALPAAASADEQVPAGQVQHTVRVSQFETNAAGLSWSRRGESWVSQTRARTVTTDAQSGALISECVRNTTQIRCYLARENKIIVGPARDAMGSWAAEAANIRAQVDKGWFRVAGDTTFQDQPATQLEVTDQAVGEKLDSHTIIAEPGTLFPLKRIVRGTNGDQQFAQTDEVLSREVLGASQVSLAMSSHPGARVVYRGKARRAAQRKAAARG